jgi:hypothetical protein
MRIGYLAAAAFSALLMATSGSWAADGGSGGGQRAGVPPLGAPPSSDASVAYAFRAYMSREPACQRLSREADNIFIHSQMDMDTKVGELNRVEALARQNRCLQKYPMARGSSGGQSAVVLPRHDAVVAYTFRAHMSQEPVCQRLSREADNIFIHSGMDAETKVRELNRVEALARQNRCLQKYPMARGGG